jgi:hypothetical protein
VSRKEPANADAVEAIVAQRTKTVTEQPGIQASIEVAWRDKSAMLPVITMPIDRLRFNPETHRIKAQRDFRPDGDASIKEDPWGQSAQEYLASLLAGLPLDPSRVDPAFTKLEDDLRTYGQKDPGIITPSGVLINGNSRCAALRRIGEVNMRVAVLPTDWDWDDVAMLELDLQMRRDYKRDYSYVNFLIAIDESVATAGPELATRAFHLQKTTLDKHLWLLAILRDLVSRSGGAGGSLNLRHRAYFAAQKSDPAAAERVKEGRLLALLLDKSKTDLRFVGENFLDDYLAKNLPVIAAPSSAAATQIPGLTITIPNDVATDQRLAGLVDQVARARVQMKSTDTTIRESGQKVYADLESAVERSIDAAGRVERLKKRKTAAVEKLTIASDTLEACIGELALAKSKNALDEAALNDAFLAFAEVFNRLAKTTLRLVESDGAGYEWLEKVRTLE